MATICLVACASSKLSCSAPSEQLYISPLFKKSRTLAVSWFDRWYILSAKYGLLVPDQVIEPYEETLSRMSRKERLAWAQTVLDEIIKCTNPQDRITFLAGIRYRENLIPVLSELGYTINVPLEGVPIGKQLSWLKRVNSSSKRIQHLERFYSLLSNLEHGLGGKRIVKYCTGRMDWPNQGVYFIFEPSEMRALDSSTSRVCRVGTHGVSRGSRSTLWNRLRTHRGTQGGSGNHRSSVFRLHVGVALIERSAGLIAFPSWGQGQSAAPDIRTSEAELEQMVSEYIGQMSLLWLEVPGEPGPMSDRAFIEMNTIALLSGPNGPIDLSSKSWLGRFSPHESIRLSGLWNVNYVHEDYDYRFLDVLEEYVDLTLGLRSAPTEALLPRDWKTKSQRGISKQLPLFGGENK